MTEAEATRDVAAAKAHVEERCNLADSRGWDRMTFYIEALRMIGAEHLPPRRPDSSTIVFYTAAARAAARAS